MEEMIINSTIRHDSNAKCMACFVDCSHKLAYIC
jgi:hypothetical protein